jgi:hypothetical protein
MTAPHALVYGAGMRGPDHDRGFGDAILDDPEWLPHRLAGASLEFVRLTDAERRALPFLDRKRVREDAPRASIPLADIGGRTRPAAECHFIFHSGFCRSTLMARALDSDGLATVLREPQVLIDLVDALPASGATKALRGDLDAILALLQRPPAAGEAIIVKPSNFANPLIDAILDLRPGSRALLMHTSLPAFLLAIVRRGTARRPWARHFARLYRRHPQIASAAGDLLLLTDLEAAAFVWLNQQAHFARLARELPPGRVATLDAEAFLAAPARALLATAALFDLPLGEAEAASIAAGAVFRRHSKQAGRPYEAEALKRENAKARSAYGREIAKAVEWAVALAAATGVPMTLPAPLLDERGKLVGPGGFEPPT